MCIGEAELFGDEACDGVSDEKDAAELSWHVFRTSEGVTYEHDNEEDDSLEERFEERIREVSDAVDGHREDSVVRSESRQFAVDPIADASESEGDRDDDSDAVDEVPEVVSIFFCKKVDARDDAEESSVKTHTSLPDLDDLYRI